MLLPRNAKQLFINGPVGQLDCLELVPTNETPVGIGIIFHPDPKAGGTYTNKIVQTIAKVLNTHGYICYCPNLRGVGLSDGVHDYGNGEVNDGFAIYEYAKLKFPGLPVTVAGFSFGTRIAATLVHQAEYRQLILVGPAVTRYEVQVENTQKTIVLHGDEDEVIALSDVLHWSKQQQQSIIVVPNCGHFFHGKLVELQNLLFNLVKN